MAWFLVPYKRRADGSKPIRYCAMDDFTAQIVADGGTWSESEVLGNMAVVKVQASSTTLSAIAATAGFTRIPVDRLADPLSSLSSTQRTAIKNKVLALGYTAQEVTDALGTDLSQITLGQLLRFVASRRLQPRYDAATDTILCDGPVHPCVDVGVLDRMVG